MHVHVRKYTRYHLQNETHTRERTIPKFSNSNTTTELLTSKTNILFAHRKQICEPIAHSKIYDYTPSSVEGIKTLQVIKLQADPVHCNSLNYLARCDSPRVQSPRSVHTRKSMQSQRKPRPSTLAPVLYCSVGIYEMMALWVHRGHDFQEACATQSPQ